MDRADSGRIEVSNQIEPIVRLVLGTFLQTATAGGPDAVAHFAGGALGERDGHQLSQPRPARSAVRLEFGQEAFGEHEGLARERPPGAQPGLFDEAQPVGAQLGEGLAIVRVGKVLLDRPGDDRPDAGHLGDLVLGGTLQLVERRKVLDQKLGVDSPTCLMPKAKSTRA